MKRLLIGCGVAAVGFCASAAAQEAGEGLLNAVAYNPVPARAAVMVRPLDNSDDNLVLQKIFETELTTLGFSVSKDSKLVLTFETRDVVGAYLDRNVRHIIELSASGGRNGGEDARARVNVFDSSSGGLLNAGGDSPDTTIITPTQYRVDVTLDDKEAGRRLWQAWAVADLDQTNGQALTRAMVPPLTRAIGRTVRQQPFQLP